VYNANCSSPRKIINGAGLNKQAYAVAWWSQSRSVELILCCRSKIGFNGRTNHSLWNGKQVLFLCFDKMVEKELSPAYASKLIQYGWETVTEALKHGGITNMMDRLSNRKN
jgi:ketol-acid reductoisomerase